MNQVKSHIRDLYRVKATQGRGEYLRLDMNENPEGIPEEFFNEVIKGITPQMLAMYPETGELTSLLANYLGVRNDNITVTNGSDEAIKSIFEVFGCPKKKVVTVYPTFEMYPVYAKMYDMEHVAVEYTEDMHVSAEKVCNYIDENTAIVAVLNPNNPIGTVFSNNEVENIILKAEKNNATVIIDEAYYYFYNKTFMDLLKKHKNLILVRTFSKLCSLAGCRIGYAVSSPEIIELIDKVRPTYCVNTVAIHFAVSLIKSPQIIDSLIAKEKEGRSYLQQQLIDSHYQYYAEHGNFIFIECRANIDEVVQTLKQQGVLVKQYSHPLLKKFIRISTGARPVMEKFWKMFQDVEERLMKQN